MAFDPLKPTPKFSVGLPTVDAAMNKLSPASAGGGKSGEDEAEKLSPQKEKKLLARVLKRMERSISYESDNRKAALEDLKFKAGEQWPPDVIAQRNIDRRPCLTINKVPTFVHQVTNAQRENRPSININPVGDRGDPEVAKMYRGMIRAIERDCAADVAYDTGFESAASNGYGFWRVLTEHESPKSMNQIIHIQRIRNPFTVYLDPNHMEPDGSDIKWAFVSELIPRDEFENQWPKADPVPWQPSGLGETMKNWVTQDEIRIAEYFEIEEEMRTLVQLDNGHVGWKDELDDITRARLARAELNIVAERESLDPQIKWYKLTAKEVLEEKDWPGRWIPIVKVIGDEVDIEGKVKYSGIVRFAKDPQRMYNYWSTAETELIALAPKAPWIMEEGQVEGHEDDWKSANTQSNPYLLYKGTSVAGRPAPPPQRQQFAGVPMGVVQAKQGAAQDMMATTGVRFDATLNERMFDESGKAIKELRRSGDIGSFHYFDNQARSLRFTGQILVDLIPKIYDTKRTITILREDESEEQVQIDPSMQGGYQEIPGQGPGGRILKMFNPGYGRYGVTVTIGPSYATKRIEASENMMAFARALPQTASLVADLIAKNQDWPGAEEIAKRIAATLPPNLLMPDQKDLTPQVQALIQGLQQQGQQLQQQLQQAMAALQDKQADRAIITDKNNKDFEARLLQAVLALEQKVMDVEQKNVQVAADMQMKSQESLHKNIGMQIKDLADGVKDLMQQLAQPAPQAKAKSDG